VKTIFVLLFVLSSTKLFSQDINGSWIGKAYFGTDTVTFILEIEQNEKNNISGYTTAFFKSGNYAKARISGKYFNKNNSFEFSESEIIKKTSNDLPVIRSRFSLQFANSAKDELKGRMD
jgi:hypothetical protein